ncbi:MAG: signal peptidase II [Abditibacteriota bacterium]|nr:signal peptidase II [Abditibacteriota bacterium]
MHRNLKLLILTALAAAAADLAVKLVVLSQLRDRSIDVIPGFFSLTLSFNYGAAFGILKGNIWPVVFIFALMLAAGISYRTKLTRSRGLSIAFGLVLGGGAANLADRLLIAPRGSVTDFLDFHIAHSDAVLAYPTFNVADACIVVGCIAIIYLYRFIKEDS